MGNTGETINYGGTPGITEDSPEQRIASELRLKQRDADVGKIEAFWSVDIQRNQAGEPVPTVTIVVDRNGTDEQRETIRQHLWGIADVLRAIYSGD
ncbi:MAG TPA: hypothetical protein DCZ63_08575 [Geobacter sp.]|nr:hypothetical protein [Geobacter sp.]